MTQSYSILKWTEGGPDARLLVWQCKHAGLKAWLAPSPYVGHTAIAVEGCPRLQRRARVIIYGPVVWRRRRLRAGCLAAAAAVHTGE